MLKGLLHDLATVYRQLLQQARPLAKVSLLWLVLAYLGLALAGVRDMVTQSAIGPQAVPGAVIHVLALLSGWYSAHRYLMEPNQKVDYLPSPRLARFIFTQIMLVLALVLLATILFAPLMFSAMPALDTQLTEEELRKATDAATRPYLPLVYIGIIWIFGRFLLAAPLMVRGAPGAVRTSWRLTKGHMSRYLLLQAGCLLPVAVGSGLSFLLAHVFYALSLLAGLAGTFVSILAYTQLAENEYARLKR